MGYGSNSSYQGGGGVPKNPYRVGRKDYEELRSGGSREPRMQSMEVLSGREYGLEYERDGEGVIKHRWALYGLVGFLLLVILVAPHHDSSSSDFHMAKDGKENATSTKQPADTSASASTQSPPALSSTTQAPASSKDEWTVTSAPIVLDLSDTEMDQPAYISQCHLPSTFRLGRDEQVYLNVTNFCLAKPLLDVPCMCSDPVKPAVPRVDPKYPHGPEDWPRAMNMNIALVNQSIASGNPLDVVFLGDSISEKWNGRSSGEFRPKDHNVSVVFQQLFQKHQNGSEVEGLALGISGDRCENLLYRLQHGEMPPALKPKVWWILIGTNNLGADSCSADAITAGNIRIVQEIRRQHPTTPIVINSILPRGSEELLHSNDMWSVIQTINQRLECFARFTIESSAPVKFFNATRLFTYDDTQEEKDYGREVYINETLMNDYLHPSGEGAMVWGREIVKMVLAMTPAAHN